ncbi:hypothetical protein STEG23_004229 [Scotinomys teguina]
MSTESPAHWRVTEQRKPRFKTFFKYFGHTREEVAHATLRDTNCGRQRCKEVEAYHTAAVDQVPEPGPMEIGYTGPMEIGYTGPMEIGYTGPMEIGYTGPMEIGYTGPMQRKEKSIPMELQAFVNFTHPRTLKQMPVLSLRNGEMSKLETSNVFGRAYQHGGVNCDSRTEKGDLLRD